MKAILEFFYYLFEPYGADYYEDMRYIDEDSI